MSKTVTTEFTTLQAADTKNPAATGRTPGGSSSGSAFLVQREWSLWHSVLKRLELL